MQLIPDEDSSFRCPDDPGEPTTDRPRVSVTELEAKILAAFVVGRRVFEIGTGLGVSTRAMAESATEVVTCDVDPWVHETVWPELPANVTTTTGAPLGEVDAVFIDGDHSTEATVSDVQLAVAVCRAGAVILVHDANAGTVRKGLTHPDWRFIPTTHGIGVLWL